MSRTELDAALARHSIELPKNQVDQIGRYCQHLWQKNEELNLTRHTDYETFVSRDVLDSMQLAKLLEPKENVMDVGTGGGVPGVLLAILRPDVNVSLCESVTKKANAVAEIAGQLDLKTSVFGARAETILEEFVFDTLVARAVGPLWKMLKWFENSWPAIGRVLAVKGPNWVNERAEARHRGLLKKLELRRVVSYQMPGRDSESVILQLTCDSKNDKPRKRR